MTHTISEKEREFLGFLQDRINGLEDIKETEARHRTLVEILKIIGILIYDFQNPTTTPSNDHKTEGGTETDFLNKNGTKVDWCTADYMFTTTPNFIIWDKKRDKQYKPIYRAYDGKVHELLINSQGALKLNNGEGYSESDEDGEPLHLRYEVRWNPTPYTEIADRKPHITLELPEGLSLAEANAPFTQWFTKQYDNLSKEQKYEFKLEQVYSHYWNEWLKTLKK